MAFPTILSGSVTSTTITTNSSTHAVTLPPTIVAGDLICVIASTDSNGVTWASPGGSWIEIFQVAINSTGPTEEARFGMWVLDAVGDEDGTTANWTVSGATSQKSAYQSFIIPVNEWSGDTANIEATTSNPTGTGTAPDPPSETASWGSADNLWIAACGWDDSTGGTTISGTSYPETDNRNTLTEGSSGGSGIAWCTYDGAAAATRDPGTFTINNTEAFAAATIVIRPVLAVNTTITVPTGPLR